ncbi:MAG: hypothetical protein ACK562_01430 [Acidobacteriota bacterium]
MRKKARYCPHCGVPVAARPVVPAQRTTTGAPEGIAAVESPRADLPSGRRTDAGRESPRQGPPDGLPVGLPEGAEVAPPLAGPDLAGPSLAIQSDQSGWSPEPADAARVDPFRPAPVSLAALILLAAGLVFLLAWLAIG